MKKLKLITLLTSLIVHGVALADLNTGLIAHWSFDDCTAKDSSSNLLDGTIIGDPKCVDGVTLKGSTNKALVFNGNDAIQRLYSDIPAFNYTISVWVKATDLNSGIFAVSAWDINKNTDYDRNIYLKSGKFCQRIWSYNQNDQNNDGFMNYISCTAKPINNEFNLITLVVTDTSTRHYVNGELVKKINSRPSEFDYRDRFFLGFGQDASHDYFKGILDEFRYYNRVLSDSEVKSLFKESISIYGSVKGLNSVDFNVECQNITTGQNVMLTTSDFNCETSGLMVSPNDIIHINVDGKAK
jgi:hypothetical protein